MRAHLPNAEASGKVPRAVSRRTVLQASGAVTAGAVLASAAPAQASPVSTLTEQRAMLLGLARVYAGYPCEPPAFGETGAAVDRATSARLIDAERAATPRRLQQARNGASIMLRARLQGAETPVLLRGLGRLAAGATTSQRDDLTAAVALAATTLARHLDPNSNAAADIWLGGLSEMARRGVSPTVAGAGGS